MKDSLEYRGSALSKNFAYSYEKEVELSNFND